MKKDDGIRTWNRSKQEGAARTHTFNPRAGWSRYPGTEQLDDAFHRGIPRERKACPLH